MKEYLTNRDYITIVLLKIWPWIAVILVILIAVVNGIFGKKVDPIDNSVNKSRKIIEHLYVKDTTNNGFRVVFASKDEITEARLEETKFRESLKQTFIKIQTDAPSHFGNMVETNIYDFAEYLLLYDLEPEIHLHNIFIYGIEKSNKYIGTNPNIKNSAKFINHGTQQGYQYLSHDDIYNLTNSDVKIYRYWKCAGINSFSYSDENFSHFSEDERIW